MVSGLISVILPNYNHSKYLHNRIKSILNQSHKKIELIILDDCSNDNSRSIIDEYVNEKRISKIIYNQINSGSPFLQWEKGIRNASGEFIWIAESDDLSSEMFLEEGVSALSKDPSLILFTCRTYHIDENGNVICPNTWGEAKNPNLWQNDFTMNGVDLIKNYLLYRNVIPNASSVVFRNIIGDEINILNNYNWNFCGDWFFWFLILKKGDFRFSSKYLNFQRSVGDNSRKIQPFYLEKKRYQESIFIVDSIKNNSDIRLNLFNKHILWIHQTYVERTKFRDKFSYEFWLNIQPLHFKMELIAVSFIYMFKQILFRLILSLKIISNKVFLRHILKRISSKKSFFN